MAGIYPGLNRRERRKVEALDWAEQEYSIDEGDLRLRFWRLRWLPGMKAGRRLAVYLRRCIKRRRIGFGRRNCFTRCN